MNNEKKDGVISTLSDRGFLGQITDPDLQNICKKKSITLYAGFDPSADSLHIGNLKQMMMMAQFQRHGHSPIALIGGGTGMIGDPSGKSKERVFLSKENLESNIAGIQAQLERFLDFSSNINNPARLVNNADWLEKLSFIDFLRDIGRHFRVGEMLAKESVKLRLNSDEGISFTEFCYMLLQAYDFLYLLDKYGCELQIGGSDQWGNITAGIDLIRKERARTVYGLTSPLVLTATGQKFGKTGTGTIWLSEERTSPYEFYQYWINADDHDIIDWLKVFTFVELEEITELEKSLGDNPEYRKPHLKLAYEVTSLVHGKEKTDGAVVASGILFGGEIKDLSNRDLLAIFEDVPGMSVLKDQLFGGIALIELMAESGFTKSKNEARRLVNQGGVYINNVMVDNNDRMVTLDDLASESILVLRTGKKKYFLIKAK